MSKTFAVAVVAAAALMPAAHGSPLDAQGCSLQSLGDTGVVRLSAGPVVVPEEGTLVCTVQGDAKAGTAITVSIMDVCVHTPEGVVCVYDSVLSSRMFATSALYVCTSFVPASGAPVRYWADGTWVTDANVPCAPATSIG